MTGTARRATKQREAVESYLSDGATFVSAQQIYAGLRGRSGLTPADFTALQGSVTDNLASAVVPSLVSLVPFSSWLPSLASAPSLKTWIWIGSSGSPSLE